jgi:hypothetical protein
MATSPGQDFLSDDDRKLLTRFLSTLRSLLRSIIERPGRYLPRDARELAPDALRQLEDRGAFETVERAIESREYDRFLIDHGLSGAELRLKIALYESARSDYEQRGRLGYGRRTRRLARRTLEFADVLLGSIAGALPGPSGVAAGAIQELKQAIEAALTKPR